MGPPTISVRFNYRLTNTLVRVAGPGDPNADYSQVSGPVRTWTYDGYNRLTELNQPESGVTRYANFDLLGRPLEIRRRGTSTTDEITQLTYDEVGRLTRQQTVGTPTLLTIEYDALGRAWRQASEAVTTTLAFDAASRPTSRTDTWTDRTFQSHYSYSTRGELLSVTYPGPTARVVSYTYQPRGRLTEVRNNGTVFAGAFTYDSAGRLVSYTTGAVTHHLTPDRLGRPSRLHTTGVQAQPNLDLTYTYDHASNVVGIQDTRPSMSQTFGYDALDRLTSATGPWGTLQWTYDATGNRTKEVRDATTLYSYDATTNRLLSISGAASDTFTYDAFGRVTQDARGTYTYTPTDALTSVTAPGLAATYLTGADRLRFRRSVNGRDQILVRGLGGEVLSEFEDECGARTWRRDLVYGAGVLIGAVKNAAPTPTVQFSAATSTAGEGAGTAAPSVVLGTTTPLACPVTVTWQSASGSAIAAQDFTGAGGVLTFPAGSPNGAVLTTPVGLVDDAVYEGAESFSLALATPIGAVLGPQSSHSATITDNDPMPQVSVSDVSVSERDGLATFTVSASPMSAAPITVPFTVGGGSATAGLDYVAPTGPAVVLAPYQSSGEIQVPILSDSLVEATETFLVTLGTPTGATLGTHPVGTGQILDTTSVIDPLLPGWFFADASGGPSVTDTVIVANPHGVAVPVILTFVKPDGTWVRRTFTLAANGRATVPLASEPGVAGTGDVSVAVQSGDVAHPIEAEHTVYWGTNNAGGRSTEGAAPAPVWYLPEGAWGGPQEWVTVFKPSDDPAVVTFDFLQPDGTVTPQTASLAQGPARVKVRVTNWLPYTMHGTRVTALTAAGAPVPVVVERTTTWGTGGAVEGHSSAGTSGLSPTWYFAEGQKGFLETHFAILNPNLTAASVRLSYKHENGQTYQQTVTVGATAKVEVNVANVSTMPDGAFATTVTVLTGPDVAVERSAYRGTAWEIAYAGMGSPALGTTWHFADGVTSSTYATSFILANPTTSSAPVTLTFVKADGTVVTHTLTLAAGARTSVAVKTLPGMATAEFQTTVTTTGTGIVAERLTYWPGEWYQWIGAHLALGRRQ